jgi:hypothetical protein
MPSSEPARPWSATDDNDMRRYIEQNHSIEEIAQFLDRGADDTRRRLELLADEEKALFPKDVVAS